MKVESKNFANGIGFLEMSSEKSPETDSFLDVEQIIRQVTAIERKLLFVEAKPVDVTRRARTSKVLTT